MRREDATARSFDDLVDAVAERMHDRKAPAVQSEERTIERAAPRAERRR